MRTVAIEEHFSIPQYQEAIRKTAGGATPVPSHIAAILQKQMDLGAGRLADMDAAGIDVQVLSLSALGLEKLDPATATSLTRECNDVLAGAVKAHPDRFAGFAHLALQDPESAAAELERSVNRLGLKGVMVSGMTNGRFLDDPVFEPVLAEADRLGVPIYLHPAAPPPEVFKAYFSGLPQGVGSALSMSGWGWHAENGLHSLRLVVSGVFDRFPKLQIIIGHMGEGIPFFLARAEEKLGPVTHHLQRQVSDYFHTNFHISTSGYFTAQPLLCALTVFGAERILFGIDYPYSPNTAGRSFLDTAPLSPADLEKIAHLNAERLLKL